MRPVDPPAVWPLALHPYRLTMVIKLPKVPACLWMLLNAVVALRRGPHHPHGQTPVDHTHHHYQPRDSESLTGDAQLLHDARHIEEDIGVLTPEEVAKMTPEEMEFLYFSSHDFDKNSMLDGLELLKAVYHTVEHDERVERTIDVGAKDFDTYVSLVDRTLEADDTDGDGFVSYAEYRAAREKDDRSHSVLASTT